MAGLDAGRLSLQYSATVGSEAPTGPVGFRMEGPFSFDGGGSLPVLDMRYTRLLGGREVVTRLVSTGEAVFVVSDGQVTEVPPEQAALLRLGDGGEGVTDLGISGWVRDPKVEDRADGMRVVTGPADVGDLLSDLARIADQLGGAEGGEGLDADAAARLERLVRSSEVTVEIAEDGLPRSVRAVVDFGRDVPVELVEALGPFASAHLELTLALARQTTALRVDVPTPGP